VCCEKAGLQRSECRCEPHVLHQARRQHVINEPLSTLLAEGNIASEPRRDQHLMRGLKHTLQVRRIPLSKRQLLSELIERDSPCYGSILARHLQETIQTSGDRGREVEVSRRRERDNVPGGNVRPDSRANRDSGVARLRCRQRRKQRELIAIARTSPLDGDGAQDGEASIESGGGGGIEVHTSGFQRRALEPAQGGAELFVRSAVDASTNRPQKCVERERDDAIIGAVGLVVPMQELDVDVLVERAGDAIAWRREDAPSTARFGRVNNRGIVSRIAQAKQWQCFERAIENDRACGGSPVRGETHAA